jgi:hypothetical protein
MAPAYEQQKFFRKIKEIFTLTVFIFLAAIVSIVVMDLLSLPVLKLVTDKPALFTKIVSTGCIVLIAGSLIIRFTSALLYYRSNGYTLIQTLKKMVIFRLHHIVFVIFAFLLFALLSGLLYIIFRHHSMLIQNFI